MADTASVGPLEFSVFLYLLDTVLLIYGVQLSNIIYDPGFERRIIWFVFLDVLVVV